METAKPSLWGGPVSKGAVFILFNGSLPSGEGWTIEQEENPISVGISLTLLRSLIETKSHFEILLGYAGWSPGQLDQEIQRGSWLYSDLDPSILLSMPLKDRYDFAIAHLGLQKEKIWMNPIDE